MDKIVEIYEALQPVINLIEENKIESKISELEDNLKVNDDDWEVLEEVRTSMWDLTYAYERFEEMNKERQ